MLEEGLQSRRLLWDGCDNARDVGGYPTANGGQTRRQVLIRSDSLHGLTPEGQTALRDYGVRTIIDLRLAHELERHPNPFAARQAPGYVPRYINLPIHDLETDVFIDASDSTQAEYIVILERSKEHIARIIEAVAAGLERGTVLVHCQGGKDRTAIIVALLLSLVGVSHELIAEDYALSEALLEPRYLEWVQEQIQAHGKHPEKPRQAQTRPETMHAVLDYLDRVYGGAEGYLLAAGVGEAGIAQVREHLASPADRGSS